MPDQYDSMTNKQIDRVIAEAPEIEDILSDSARVRRRWYPPSFSTDLNATHAAWRQLSHSQKVTIRALVREAVPEELSCIAALDADARQLAVWIARVVGGAK